MGHACRLVSLNGNKVKSWPRLAEEIAHAVRANRVERICPSGAGAQRSQRVAVRREWPDFYAFDSVSLEART